MGEKQRHVRLMIIDASARNELEDLETAINQEVESFIEAEKARLVQLEVKHHGPHHDPPIIYLYLLYEKL